MANEGFHLVCIHPFSNYTKGQMITDPAEVQKLLLDREHHFNRITEPNPGNPPAVIQPKPADDAKTSVKPEDNK